MPEVKKELTAKSKTLFFCSILLISAFALPAVMLAQSQTPYFQITLIVPGPNPSRKAWAQMPSEWNWIGIPSIAEL
jgi:hypothetical protein